MQVGVFANDGAAADFGARYIIEALAAAKKPVLGVATGSTPLPLYERLRAAHAAGEFNLADAHAVALDEYVGLPEEHAERYRNVLRTELVGDDKTGLRDENLHTPDALADDPNIAAREYDETIAKVGPVTLQILGIGSDGHIAFNEPGGSLTSRTHVETLTAQTRQDNARFFEGDLDKVPTLAISQGLGTIMEAEEIVLFATGAGKADAVRELVEGGVSAKVPATILQMHNNVIVLVDEAAASKLELSNFYAHRFNSLRK